jgi:hypothetical protein
MHEVWPLERKKSILTNYNEEGLIRDLIFALLKSVPEHVEGQAKK